MPDQHALRRICLGIQLLVEDAVEVAGEVALEEADGVSAGFAFGDANSSELVTMPDRDERARRRRAAGVRASFRRPSAAQEFRRRCRGSPRGSLGPLW